MKKFYSLGSCNTCQRILKEINASKLELVDIKFNPVNENQLEEMRKLTDSFESLFSRKAMKFRSLGLHELTLTENDYKKYILALLMVLFTILINILLLLIITNSKNLFIWEKINTFTYLITMVQIISYHSLMKLKHLF